MWKRDVPWCLNFCEKVLVCLGQDFKQLHYSKSLRPYSSLRFRWIERPYQCLQFACRQSLHDFSTWHWRFFQRCFKDFSIRSQVFFGGFDIPVSIVSPCFPHKGHELSRLPRQDTVAPRTPLEKKLLVAFCQVQMAGSWLGKIAGNSWSSRSVKTNW